MTTSTIKRSGQRNSEAPLARAAAPTLPTGAKGFATPSSDPPRSGTDSPAAIVLATPSDQSPQGHNFPGAMVSATPTTETPRGPFLADPFLALHAEIVTDLEGQRIANENRLRTLTALDADSDGVVRGFGLDESHPDVAQLAALVETMGKLEHQAVLNLQRAIRKNPLGPWVKATKGVGEKQAARLLGCIGDPYWNTLHNRPRKLYELYAYCGLHVLPASHYGRDDRTPPAGGDQTGSDPGQAMCGTHDRPAGVAARRRKGVKSNWNADAKMRAWLIGAKCVQVVSSPYREVYLARRAHTLITHPDWTLGHSHNDGIRIAAKAVLRDLWRESKRLHEEQA